MAYMTACKAMKKKSITYTFGKSHFSCLILEIDVRFPRSTYSACGVIPIKYWSTWWFCILLPSNMLDSSLWDFFILYHAFHFCSISYYVSHCTSVNWFIRKPSISLKYLLKLPCIVILQCCVACLIKANIPSAFEVDLFVILWRCDIAIYLKLVKSNLVHLKFMWYGTGYTAVRSSFLWPWISWSIK